MGVRDALRAAKVRILESVYTKRAPVRLDRSLFSFTFDDAPLSAGAIGGRALEDAGARGTYYVASGLAGQSNLGGQLLTAGDVAELGARGHDIQCHTCTHLDLRRTGPGRIIDDCRTNRDFLSAALGGTAIEHFAYPYGAVSPWAKRALRSTYKTMRTTDFGINRGTVDLSHLRAVELFSHRLDRERITALLTSCAAEPGWVIFYTHELEPRPTQWGATPDDFRWALEQCRAVGEVLTVREAFAVIESGSAARR